ncbi:hypothetical protein JX265_004027 [Neoarthrinium moseri]|uniref:Fe2OG dioxygenase domain-containing protein n=1 Tax=Neoarthrinium moseri TaxID=1658444 RepID=A0A9P9WRR2_9PEZI|nr:hypothetical protein JX265_004027 [Neoarthrinium moseri]
MPEAAKIPIIDISADGADQAQVAKALVDAAAEYGFVYIKNAGKDISAEQIENAFNVSRTLFSTPTEEKQKCKIQKNNQGWSGMHTETLDPKTQRVGDFKEAFNFGPFSDGKATQPIPSTLSVHEASIGTFRGACEALCRKLLLLFGQGLGVDPADFFEAAHSPERPSGSILRLLYYPPPNSGATAGARGDDLRAGAHSDYGSITLLFRVRGQAGLEVLTPANAWAPVPVCPPGTEHDPSPPILVNIGDLLSYWTNGLLRSTVHRVAFEAGGVEGESTSEPRYSIAFFCHPASETRLVPVPSQRVREFRGDLDSAKEGNPYAERMVLTADEHLQMRLQASYLQLYEKEKAETK